MTVQTQAVLQALLADPHAELFGLEIAKRTGLLPGTTYPILVRLQQAGWVRDRWEIVDTHDEQRPRRRYYQLTDQGVAAARAALHRTRARASRTASHLGMTVDGST
jgi:PadR family transcriptional regulator, regulatory protein PadR